jgi:hypothetical protein
MQTLSHVYDSYAQAERAVIALEAAGVPSSDISLVANKYVSEQYANVDEAHPTATGAGAGIGAVVGGGAGLLTGLGLMAIPGLGPVVAAGWLATTALGTVAGSATGGVIGALVGAGTSADHAHVYSEAVRRGGTLVTVRHDLPNGRVESILNASNPIDPVARRNEYSQTGWKQFDPTAPAYKPDQAEIERMRRANI